MFNINQPSIRNLLLFELFWFIMAQLAGIFVAHNVIVSFIKSGEKIRQVSPSDFSLPSFLISFLGVIIFILLISKFSKGKNIIFKAFFALIAFLGGEVFLESFLPTIIALPIILILIFFWFKTSSIWIHNLLLVLGTAGIGGFVGSSLSSQVVVILFFILAIYDLIAVYQTRHMIKIAKSMAESQAVLGIIIPKKISDFNKKLKDVNIGDEKRDFLVLGSGDIIFPLILTASFLPQGIAKSGTILIFSLSGLLFGFWLFFKLGQKPMPALPPLAIFCIIGYFIANLI